MAYIGYTGALGNIQKIDPLTFNSSSTTFDIRVNGLLVAVASSTSMFISVSGVIQEPNVDYTVSGSSIIFSAAPLTGLSFFGIILGSSVNIGTPSDGTVTNVKIGETISVAKGGTGATTADAALTNLGGGATGKAVFGSATQANARAQLGLGTSSVLNVGTSTGDVVQLVTGNKLPAVDGSNLTGILGVPVGGTIEWNATTEPTNYMFEDGRAISRTTYATLFSIIGTTFGAGNGSTTFNIPNSLDRVAVGAGSLYELGATGGSKDAIVVAHGHSVNDPGHSHGVNDPGHSHSMKVGASPGTIGFAGPMNYADNRSSNASGTGISINGNVTGISVNNNGSSGTNANMMPYIAKRKIIRVL
jgi:microcystin-dependent protein